MPVKGRIGGDNWPEGSLRSYVWLTISWSRLEEQPTGVASVETSVESRYADHPVAAASRPGQRTRSRVLRKVASGQRLLGRSEPATRGTAIHLMAQIPCKRGREASIEIAQSSFHPAAPGSYTLTG